MAIKIIPGSTWGRRPWASALNSVPMTERRFFVVHYDGGNVITRTGNAVPRTIDNEHHNNGWSGVGYNFVVDQAGNVYEGRGWNIVGAHCPSRNRDGIGVQVAIGGDQVPSEAAKRAVVAIYAEACRLSGRSLTKTYHGAHYATSCAGGKLIPWVKAGMPLVGSPTVPRVVVPTKPIVKVINVVRVLVGKLAVDGIWGASTTRQWQIVMGTPADGVVSKPSSLIRAVQRRVGVNADGLLGPLTWKAIQRRLGVTPDGIAGPMTIRALQTRLNTNRF